MIKHLRKIRHKTTLSWHNKLRERFSWYHHWHSHPFHVHFHWALLAIFLIKLLVLFGLYFSAVPGFAQETGGQGVGPPESPVASLEPTQVTEVEPELPTPTSISVEVFNRNLGMGDYGDDVQALQQFLNKEGFTVAQEGYGSQGNETKSFGSRTQEALKRFQEANAIHILNPSGPSSGTGFFGSSTRNFINSLIKL